MRTRHPSFRRLRWKLTLSYTLVTVSALIAVVIVLLGVSFAAYLVTSSSPVVAAELTNRVAPTLSPYFTEEGADLEGLYRWIEGARQRGIAVQGADQEFELSPEDLARLPVRLLIFDTSGLLVGYDDQVTALPAPIYIDPKVVPGLAEVLPRALAGETDPARLQVQTGSQGLAVAAPIFGDGRVNGTVVLVGPFRPPVSAFLSALMPIGISVIAVTIGAGMIGTAFGYFTARGLTRRLDHISRSASSWGRGDFTPRVSDTSLDELGELGRGLNQMAREFEALMDARQRLSAVEERNRLARDLHDSVKQQVFAITMNLGAAQALWDQDRTAARHNIDAAFELARWSQQELSTVIQALRPVDLTDTPVREALEELVDRWGRETDIRTVFEADGQEPLPPNVEDALYRIIQEALANVARHSGASSARVTFTVRPTAVRVDVVDNGKGFESVKKPAGMGLRTMRDRAAALDGEVTVISGPKGTIVQIHIPLPVKEEGGE